MSGETPFRVRYTTLEFGDDTDIHVRSLRDNQEFSDDAGEAAALGISSATWSLFGVLWASGCVLAHTMHARDLSGLRILEVGCGLGVASLVLNRQDQDVTATDRHPEAGGFLQANTELNGDADIPFVRADWADADCGLGRFDLIIGSDILYEDEHGSQLSEFIDRHAAPTCEVVIVDPGRGQHAGFSKAMVLLGYAHSQRLVEDVAYLDDPYRGQLLTYRRAA